MTSKGARGRGRAPHPCDWCGAIAIREGLEASTARPHGIMYALMLHDHDGTRLPGFDNAHGIPRAEVYDHRHRFRRPKQVVAYEFRGADELICDFFTAVEDACRREEVPFEFEADEIELEVENEDDEDGT